MVHTPETRTRFLIWVLSVSSRGDGYATGFAGRQEIQVDPPEDLPTSAVGLSGWATESEAAAAFQTAKLGMPRWWAYTATPVAFERFRP